jgi:hypothetical protein
MYGTLLIALAAAAAPTTDRHAGTRQAEAHQALADQHAHARQAAGALYQYSASRVVADRELAQRMVVDIARSLDTGGRELARIREGLGPTDREAVAAHLQEVQDRHGQAVSHANGLKNELARPAMDGGQLRFLAGEVYRSVALAEDAHTRLMDRLQVKLADRTGPPVR